MTFPAGRRVDGHDRLATSSSGVPSPPPPSVQPPTTPTPEQLALKLRERARQEIARGDWDLGVADLDEAKKLDPAGETPEVSKLRDSDWHKVDVREAKPKH